MKKRSFFRWKGQSRFDDCASVERMRRLEFLESRFCYSASGFSTDFLIDSLVDMADVATFERAIVQVEKPSSEYVETTSTEVEVIVHTQDYPGIDEKSDLNPDENGVDQNENICTEYEEAVAIEHGTVCGIATTVISDSGKLLDVASKAGHSSQENDANEPNDAFDQPVESGTSTGPMGSVPQLQPVEQLSIGPVTVSRQPEQPNPSQQSAIVFRSTDSYHSNPTEIIPSKVKVTGPLKPSEIGPLKQSLWVSVLSSVSNKETGKAISIKSALSVRPQLSPIPSIMPEAATTDDRTVAANLEPQVVLEQSTGTEKEPGTIIVTATGTGLNDFPAATTPAAGKLKEDLVNRKRIFVGAIIAGWIAIPRAAKGRVVGRLQAKLGRFYSQILPRDKANSSRPISLEEADE